MISVPATLKPLAYSPYTDDEVRALMLEAPILIGDESISLVDNLEPLQQLRLIATANELVRLRRGLQRMQETLKLLEQKQL